MGYTLQADYGNGIYCFPTHLKPLDAILLNVNVFDSAYIEAVEQFNPPPKTMVSLVEYITRHWLPWYVNIRGGVNENEAATFCCKLLRAGYKTYYLLGNILTILTSRTPLTCTEAANITIVRPWRVIWSAHRSIKNIL